MAGRLFPAGGARSIPLSKPIIYIGRAPECDIQLSFSVVSNRHCALIFDGTNWTIQDLGSRNGTRVNEHWVTHQVLQSGDTVSVAAKFRFTVEFDIAVERKRFLEMPEVDRGSVLSPKAGARPQYEMWATPSSRAGIPCTRDHCVVTVSATQRNGVWPLPFGVA